MILTDDGYVYQLDEATGKDGTVDIEAIYDTKDITIDNEAHKFRVSEFSFSAMSTLVSGTVQVFYSVDGGINFTEFDDSPISLNTTWTHHKLPVDIVDRRVRYRLYQNSDKDLQIRKLHHSIQLESDA